MTETGACSRSCGFRRLLLLVLAYLLGLFALSSPVLGRETEGSALGSRAVPKEALLSDNLTDQVQWDEYSLIVKGQRIFLQLVLYELPPAHLY